VWKTAATSCHPCQPKHVKYTPVNSSIHAVQAVRPALAASCRPSRQFPSPPHLNIMPSRQQLKAY
jgi:hypothetical protein